MERLISFLSHNIVFVIMIVGIIYTMFFRKSPLERPPNRMPDFGGEGFPRPRRPGETRPAGRPDARPEAEKLPSPRPAVPIEPRRQPDTVQRQQPQRTDTGWPPPRAEQPAQRFPMSNPAAAEERASDIGGRLSEEPSDPLAEPARISVPPMQTDRTGIGGRETRELAESDSSLTKDDLTRAVMWAEILGPPRARRPHRR